MTVIKCKMCGGDMTISEDRSVGMCDYCGSTMTLPKVNDEQRAAQFNRGNHFRRQGEFDKALAIYENIVREDDTDAEAHWCCALCRFGIEYVEDPATFEYLPTCHRASFDSILEDVDYLAAVEQSTGITRRQYQKEAAKIAEVQRGILATSQKEEPFDVFICYKETDADTGERSRDSIDAQEVYYQLTEKGYRVFFARVTLEDKVGAEYEPYIFAALNSAKVMIALGEKPEHFSAVWVKNEWSRYLSLMKKDRSRLLLPCYKNMDPYDLPEQLAVLQSYDMGKIGFIQDLIRGVDKVLRKDESKETVKETIVREVVQQSASGANLTAQIKRGQQALEDEDWEAADGFFDKALDMDAECAEAFLGKALAVAECKNVDVLAAKRIKIDPEDSENIIACEQDSERIERDAKEYAVLGYLSEEEIQACFSFANRTYQSLTSVWKQRIADEKPYWEQDRQMSRAIRFAKGDLADTLSSLRERIETSLLNSLSESETVDAAAKAETIERYQNAIQQAEERVKQLNVEAKERREKDYNKACELQKNAKTYSDFENAAASFEVLGLRGFLDSDERAIRCHEDANTAAEEEIKHVAAALVGGILASIKKQIATIENSDFLTVKMINNKVSRLEARRQELAAIIEKTRTRDGAILSVEKACEIYSRNPNVARAVNAIYPAAPISIVNLSGANNFMFGRASQDGGILKPIEWLILEREGDRFLVISKSVLEFNEYNTSGKRTTWDDCSLRKWLNSTFLNATFTNEEQAMIPSVTITAEKNPVYGTSSGKDTTDRVFLLSVSEANQYFKTDMARKAEGKWWLRTTGNNALYSALIDKDGSIDCYGSGVDTKLAVRPALWVGV